MGGSAGLEDYDGIPYRDLPIDEVDWTHRADYIRTRSQRKGRPEWATEAALDPRRLVGDGRSASGETIRVVGWSALADEVLTVLLPPKEHPPTGDWWGVNAWRADDREERKYAQQGDQE